LTVTNSRRPSIGQQHARLERLRRVLGLPSARPGRPERPEPSELDRLDVPTIVWRVILLLACLRVIAWVADWLEKIFPVGA
jgi:hypothetical protein